MVPECCITLHQITFQQQGQMMPHHFVVKQNDPSLKILDTEQGFYYTMAEIENIAAGSCSEVVAVVTRQAFDFNQLILLAKSCYFFCLQVILTLCLFLAKFCTNYSKFKPFKRHLLDSLDGLKFFLAFYFISTDQCPYQINQTMSIKE